MDIQLFNTSFDDIIRLNLSEGPHTNIFEPKFEARRQIAQLRETLVNVYRGEKSLLAMQQMCRCLAFTASNMIDVEEEEEALPFLRQAYTLVGHCIREELLDSIGDVEPTSMDTINTETKAGNVSPQAENQFACSVEYMQVLNALGYYYSLSSGENAKAVLELAERVYTAWDHWFREQSPTFALEDLTITEDGKLVLPETADTQHRQQQLRRFEMEDAFITTLFFLAQVSGALGQPMARCCHLTVYRQLLMRKEFSPVTWAESTFQLASYYAQMNAFGKAYHCLLAGQRIMPTEDPAFHKEKTIGKVALAFGHFYVSVLAHYGALFSRHSNKGERAIVAADQPTAKALETETYWVDFPDVAPATPWPPVLNFEQARDTFKEGIKWLQEAATVYPFEEQCTTYMDIQRTISQLYAALSHFETDRRRSIAIVQRQIALTEGLPSQLSFNAYPTDYRQLLLDLGMLHNDLIELRKQQRRQPFENETPLKDGAYNKLVQRTFQYFHQFCETWRDPRTSVLPDILPEEDRVAFFSALIHLAQTQLHFYAPSPKAEYDNIGIGMEGFQRALQFAERNPMAEQRIAKELELAKQMVSMLPAKREAVMWHAMQTR
ncbi:hypothetical protein STCU_07654 [Strigomonas culicis]|uniref:KIF-binding protein n=2 Tax=Strigomonas culicis TaxID=28005 RepID=S9U3S7_9TRYP|nr:hypothetical protein STCU_07654 [Strigomonas culicis]|eukprot:EPY23568.1 hypothetical protein STCU_07654 [Strigomonas culicis]